ncbi:type VII secretion target [Amycolatopsis pigmentata]|uniref:Type VII secretion target n=1 Tax=Amycolatopsis pigmentata TaxID=450801 RepID=A0ABW5G011_9PSEU
MTDHIQVDSAALHAAAGNTGRIGAGLHTAVRANAPRLIDSGAPTRWAASQALGQCSDAWEMELTRAAQALHDTSDKLALAAGRYTATEATIAETLSVFLDQERYCADNDQSDGSHGGNGSAQEHGGREACPPTSGRIRDMAGEFHFDPAPVDRAIGRLTTILQHVNADTDRVRRLQHVTRPGDSPATRTFHAKLTTSMRRLQEQHLALAKTIEAQIETLRQAKRRYAASDNAAITKLRDAQ